jgi:PAS domain S-box-containing protein
MNNFIRKLPIKIKIILIIMLTSTLSLLLVGTAFIFFDQYHAKKDLILNVSAIGQLIADRSSAALAFQDARLAEENLAALGMKPAVDGAWILTRQNDEFARYGSVKLDTGLIKLVKRTDGSLFQRDHLIHIFPIKIGDEKIGSLIISRSLQDFRQRLQYYILFMIIVIAASWILALVLSARLQVFISKPLLHLAGLAKRIAINEDYSLRATKTRDDEIGFLEEAFNDMLDMIEAQNAERKKSEDTLRYERLLLRTLIDNVPDAIYTKDLDCRKTLANVADVKNMHANSEEEVLGKDDFDFHPRELAEKFYADDRMVIDTGVELLKREEYVIGEQGQQKWLLTSKLPLRDENGGIIGLIGIGRDITENKEAELRLKEYYDKLEFLVQERTLDLKIRTEELVRAKEQAESADRLKSAFLATMSHELRTPLNSIIGFTGILKQGRPGPLNEEQHKQLALVQNSARHLLSLINDVLDLSKIEAGQLRIIAEVFDLKAVVQKVMDINTPLADEKKLVFRASISPEVGEIQADRQRLSQVLVNLVNNAIKFTDQGMVSLVCSQESGWIVIKVIDTGIGIEADKIETLFKPFIQIDSGTTRKHEGTGLGLSISQRLMTLMGGNIQVESEFKKGSTFIITLPVNPKKIEDQ